MKFNKTRLYYSVLAIILIVGMRCLWLTGIYAQNKDVNDKDLFHKRKVTASAEDTKFKWIGTNKGLFRIKKVNYKIAFFSRSNSNLPSDTITAICCRENGNVWIGTTDGILRYDGFAFLLIGQDNSKLPDLFVTAIAEDRNENIWVATAKGGLMKVDSFHEEVFNDRNSNLPEDDIVSLSLDESGYIIAHFQNGKMIDTKTLSRQK